MPWWWLRSCVKEVKRQKRKRQERMNLAELVIWEQLDAALYANYQRILQKASRRTNNARAELYTNQFINPQITPKMSFLCPFMQGL